MLICSKLLLYFKKKWHNNNACEAVGFDLKSNQVYHYPLLCIYPEAGKNGVVFLSFIFVFSCVLVAAVRYNDEIDDLWDLNTYSTVSQYLNAVDRIVYNGSGTLTGQALNYTLNNKFSVAEGRRPKRTFGCYCFDGR